MSSSTFELNNIEDLEKITIWLEAYSYSCKQSFTISHSVVLALKNKKLSSAKTK
ncbi:hypothetical protein LguiA_008045 [Lonicera macranthoides]